MFDAEQPATPQIPVPEQQRGRGPGRPFQKGQSGNPAGRPPGIRNRGTELAESLLAEEAAALTRKAVELALAGDGAALRLCLERLVAPRRERAVRLPLPDLRNGVDLADAMAVVSAAVANGGITPSEAGELGKFVDTFRKAIETADFEKRLQELETAVERRPNHY